MNKDKMLELVEKHVPSYKRDDVIKDIILHDSKDLEAIEKYKIDKMIESGLIKEQNQEMISKNKMLDYGYQLLKSSRFWVVLAFILMMFNSYNFWKYITRALELGK